ASPIGLFLHEDIPGGIFESTSFISLPLTANEGSTGSLHSSTGVESYCSPSSEGGQPSPRIIAPLSDVRPPLLPHPSTIIPLSAPYMHCEACLNPIRDRYVIRIDNRTFHAACLKCSMCRVELADEHSAFLRDGMLLCKTDFEGYNNYILQNFCLMCKKQFSVADMVARAGNQFAHADCFYCTLCKQKLATGQEIVLDPTNNMLCRTHIDPMVLPPLNGLPPGMHPSLLPPPPPGLLPPLLHLPPPPLPHDPAMENNVTLPSLSPTQLVPQPPPLQNPLQNPMQSAPRTAKKEESISDDEYDNDSSQQSYANGNGNNNGRSKRMRTSFKHHQLRTMKNYFNLNHNPDAKDLKQLATKTGLSKRVLQVWFQNARAKFRRSNNGRDPSSVSPSMGGSILPLTQRVTTTKSEPILHQYPQLQLPIDAATLASFQPTSFSGGLVGLDAL
ncbi:hypothetical protein PMAYCL1PPCAC_01880, partial [Pristionchus mayeri]